MPNSELAEKILAENAALRVELADLTGQLDDLEDKGRHTRWLAYALSLVLAAVLAGWGYQKVNDRVDVVQQYQVATCEAGNESRALSLDLWTGPGGVVELIDKGGPGAQAFARKLKAKAEKTYAPRDCTKVEEGKVR